MNTAVKTFYQLLMIDTNKLIRTKVEVDKITFHLIYFSFSIFKIIKVIKRFEIIANLPANIFFFYKNKWVTTLWKLRYYLKLVKDLKYRYYQYYQYMKAVLSIISTLKISNILHPLAPSNSYEIELGWNSLCFYHFWYH